MYSNSSHKVVLLSLLGHEACERTTVAIDAPAVVHDEDDNHDRPCMFSSVSHKKTKRQETQKNR